MPFGGVYDPMQQSTQMMQKIADEIRQSYEQKFQEN